MEIDGPHYVSLELELAVCVLPDYFRRDVERVLLDVLGSSSLADGSRGLFHPDHFSFADPVYLSRVYAAAQAVTGVAHVDVTAFGRQGGDLTTALAMGVLEFDRLEIARLANDPSRPESGVLRLTLAGGR